MSIRPYLKAPMSKWISIFNSIYNNINIAAGRYFQFKKHVGRSWYQKYSNYDQLRIFAAWAVESTIVMRLLVCI